MKDAQGSRLKAQGWGLRSLRLGNRGRVVLPVRFRLARSLRFRRYVHRGIPGTQDPIQLSHPRIAPPNSRQE